MKLCLRGKNNREDDFSFSLQRAPLLGIVQSWVGDGRYAREPGQVRKEAAVAVS